jgi:hypothetical protein
LIKAGLIYEIHDAAVLVAAGVSVCRLPFPPEVIIVAVRWYLRFSLSYRDVEELLIERGVEVDHVTVFRWVQRLSTCSAQFARIVVSISRAARPRHRWPSRHAPSDGRSTGGQPFLSSWASITMMPLGPRT